MQYGTLEGNLFVKPLEPKVGPPDALERPAEYVRKVFSNSADDANLELDLRNHGWPKPQERGYMGYPIHDSAVQYRYLQRGKYDADLNVLLFASLDEVGPELGHLLLRRRNALHTFVVSCESLPDRSNSIYRGITAIPVPGRAQCPELNTQAELVHGATGKRNPEERGYISFHSLRNLTPQRVQELLSLVYLRKAS
jgi:hypothetical protein